ncbi:TetR family transcriptional regulator [Altererythrobacter fulvus]|uniref:TetR family transcriptional regulator n=1 Tax=Caenibius fulvus TaxID=2126012 RepID=UPI003015B1FD
MTKRTFPSLDRTMVVDAAFALLREEGIDALSMRRLAARLQVKAPALYWHFRDKGELLGLMTGAIYGKARAGIGPCADWREWLFEYGAALRRGMMQERDAAQLFALAPPVNEGDAARAEAIAAPLTRFGLDQASALSVTAAVISFVLGWSTFEENGPMQHFLEGMLDLDRSFEAGLRALVRGFEPLPGPGEALPKLAGVAPANNPLRPST